MLYLSLSCLSYQFRNKTKKLPPLFRKRSLKDQLSSEAPSKQPIINQREDGDETSDAGHANRESNRLKYRSGSGLRNFIFNGSVPVQVQDFSKIWVQVRFGFSCTKI